MQVYYHDVETGKALAQKKVDDFVAEKAAREQSEREERDRLRAEKKQMYKQLAVMRNELADLADEKTVISKRILHIQTNSSEIEFKLQNIDQRVRDIYNQLLSPS